MMGLTEDLDFQNNYYENTSLGDQRKCPIARRGIILGPGTNLNITPR
jgi:hypothetical protein